MGVVVDFFVKASVSATAVSWHISRVVERVELLGGKEKKGRNHYREMEGNSYCWMVTMPPRAM